MPDIRSVAADGINARRRRTGFTIRADICRDDRGGGLTISGRGTMRQHSDTRVRPLPAVGRQRFDVEYIQHRVLEPTVIHGYVEITEPRAGFRLTRWLYALCWTGTDRPSVLFERATAWRVTHKVLLPGCSTLERYIARLRSRVEGVCQVTVLFLDRFDRSKDAMRDETLGASARKPAIHPRRAPC